MCGMRRAGSGMTSSSEMDRLLVIGDSLSFFGPDGGLAADDPRLWHSQVAKALGLQSELIARIGWTARDGWWALTRDPRAWSALSQAQAVILAVGSMDSLPSPLPTALREGIRYIRPSRLRRHVRNVYRWIQPHLSPVGWPMALPPNVTAHYLEKMRQAIAHTRPDIPILAVLPPTHKSASYGLVHPGREATTLSITQWAGNHHVTLIDLHDLVSPHILKGEGNADGMHWGFSGHDRVADKVIGLLRSLVSNDVNTKNSVKSRVKDSAEVHAKTRAQDQSKHQVDDRTEDRKR